MYTFVGKGEGVGAFIYLFIYLSSICFPQTYRRTSKTGYSINKYMYVYIRNMYIQIWILLHEDIHMYIIGQSKFQKYIVYSCVY